MQPSDRNIHKLFSFKTLMHANTSSKTTQHKNITLINNAIYAMHETGLRGMGLPRC